MKTQDEQQHRNPLAHNIDVIRHVIQLVGDSSYLFVAEVSNHWRRAWDDRPQATCVDAVVQSVSRLTWARDCGYRLDTKMATCKRAAAGGYFEVLKYARGAGSPWDEWTCAEAARAGHIKLLKWCKSNGCPWDGETTYWAARTGRLDILRWCQANNCPMSSLACEAAAESGSPEVLQWCRVQRVPLTLATYAGATRSEQLEIIEWCRTERCPWAV